MPEFSRAISFEAAGGSLVYCAQAATRKSASGASSRISLALPLQMFAGLVLGCGIRDFDSGFVVVRPPPGLVISVLPPYYSTVWFGGAPYYYADDVYYTWQPDQNGYAVVDPPENSDAPTPPPDSAQSDLIIYPKNGQTKEQQAADQFECHNWAKGQSGFDPTQPGGGVPGDADAPPDAEDVECDVLLLHPVSTITANAVPTPKAPMATSTALYFMFCFLPI